jgi:hypothetical protein
MLIPNLLLLIFLKRKMNLAKFIDLHKSEFLFSKFLYYIGISQNYNNDIYCKFGIIQNLYPNMLDMIYRNLHNFINELLDH